VDFKEGFIGWNSRALSEANYIQDCSEIDDIIVFRADGKYMVTRIADKKFVGKNILHAAVWKKKDKRTIYHAIYQDGKDGPAYMKRFAVSSITRDKDYDVTAETKGSKLHYFSANPNGRKELVTVVLRSRPHLKKLKFDVDFSELLIKGRSSKGNRVTKEIISKVIQKEVGGSTLAARKIWFDDVVKRLNDDGRGRLLGEFKGDDKILAIYDDGTYKLYNFELNNRFDDGLLILEKHYPERAISAVYWEPEKELYYVKRFQTEITTLKKEVLFISEEEGAELSAVCTDYAPKLKIVYNKRLKETKNLPDKIEDIREFIDVKGLKAQGNQLTKLKVKDVEFLETEESWPVEEKDESPEESQDLNNENSAPEENEESSKEEPNNSEADNEEEQENVSDDKSENNTIIVSQDEEGPVSFDLDVDDSKKKKGGKPDDNPEDQMSLF
jgi:topoisomerase-4 subunit A